MTTLTESRRFENHLTACGTTAAGAQWVKTAIDPFHDVDLDVIGMPDSTAGRSVVYAVTSNLVLDKPAGVSTGDAWDCHVAFTPCIADCDLAPFASITPSGAEVWEAYAGTAKFTSWATASGLRNSNFLTANAVPSGHHTFVNPETSDCEYTGLGVNQFLDVDGSSIIRVTGAAFEVHNTTEDIYKSGSVTSYKVAREADQCRFTWNDATGTSNEERIVCTITNGPPTSSGTAKLYNGHTWDAKDGCLIPGVLDAGEADGEKSLPRCHVVRTVKSDGAPIYWAPAMESTPASGPAAVIARGPQPRSTTGALDGHYLGNGSLAYRDTTNSPPTIVPEMMNSGAYFTGLSSQTKLTLTLRVFVEVFPAAGNSLVPLAHPSNPYDAKALQCYQEIMSHMRSGYRVNDNAFGDYFRKAIAVARAVGKTIAPVLPPQLQMMVNAADSIAAKADSALAKTQKVEADVKKALAESNKVIRTVKNNARGRGGALAGG